MQRLLGAAGGCAWSRENQPAALLYWIQSEVVEVAQEIDTNKALLAREPAAAGDEESRSFAAQLLEDELGDLIFNLVLMVGLCARESFGVTLRGAAERVCAKIERRCPYVFGEEKADTSEQAEAIWNRVKAEEKAAAPPRPASFEATVAHAEQAASDGDVVVLVAKFPTKGKTKTRMVPALGEDGAYDLSLALVRDALCSIGTAPQLSAARRVLLFAPSFAGDAFAELVQNLGVEDQWTLLPMVDDSAGLTSSDLSAKLTQGLRDARKLPATSGKGQCRGAVAFVGMDSPEQGPAVIAAALATARRSSSAFINPATDGGYTCLALPPGAPPSVFHNVHFSAPDTCLSQMNRIAAEGIPTLVGPTFQDLDDLVDLTAVQERLAKGGDASACPRTAKLLQELPEMVLQAPELPGADQQQPYAITTTPAEDGSSDVTVAVKRALRSHPSVGFVAGAGVMMLLQVAFRTRRY